jgi:predicted acyltransferase
MKPDAASAPLRLTSLDQFRGYTVLAMFLVNFLGDFRSVPAILRHHNTWCSYADTVMPQFFFAVGMALRLVMLRDGARHGKAAALRRGLQRGLLLMLVGFIWYHPGGNFRTWDLLTTAETGRLFRDVFLTNAFQALTHIGLTTLWVLPVMLGGWLLRLGLAAGSAGLHVALSHAGWYETLHEWRVIDGGPLGFLTWTLPVVAGSLAWDAVSSGAGKAWPRLLAWSLPVMAAGYALSCLTAGGVVAAPPFVPPWHGADAWTMSQRAGSVSYQLFAAGFSLAVYAVFVWWSDVRGRSLTVFTDLGTNALLAYFVHMVVMGATAAVGPDDAPLWWALLLSGCGILLSWGAVRWCGQRGLHLRL